MRVYVAALWNEANAFAPLLTAREDFTVYAGGALPDTPGEASAVHLEARSRAREGRFDLAEGPYAYASPGGLVTADAYGHFRDAILDDCRRRGPFDIIALSLHGAMATAALNDCEGDLIAALRRENPAATIGVLIDPHANLSPAMLAQADVIIAFKEYPHTDFRERATELFDLLEAAAAGRIRPVMRAFDTGMIAGFHTARSPARDLRAWMQSAETEPSLLSMSLIHGFPWADTPDTGTRALAVADGDPGLAQAFARELAERARAIAPDAMQRPIDIDAALDLALAREGRTVMADSADNPGGGAGGDATFVLAKLLERKVSGACLGPLCDPAAVTLAQRAGEGAVLTLRIGGKSGPLAGCPLDVTAKVLALDPALEQTFADAPVPLGAAATIDIGGVQVVLVSKREQALGPDLFTRMGVDLARRRIIVVKSSRHFEAGFAPVADHILTVDAPGTLQMDFAANPYRHLARPRWPVDPLPEIAPVAFPPRPDKETRKKDRGDAP